MSKQPDRIDDNDDPARIATMTNVTGIASVTGYTGAVGSKEDDVQGHSIATATGDEDHGAPQIAT